MRSLSSTLTTGQQAKSLDPLIKIVLTHGEDTYTYTKTRIKDINHPEEPYSQTCELVLDNSAGELTDIDLQGFQGVISYGVVAKAGEEYSACAPLWVIGQKFDDYPGNAKCTLSLKGIPNLMADDEASESYLPDSDDTKTVKTLLTQIIGATLSCFSHCQAYEIVWDSEDSLIDSYKPKDSFRIYTGGTRLAAVRRLIEYTKCVMRAEADGKIHIFEPTISGDTYDYQYSLDSGHVFFSKAYRKRLVIPNYIVVKSQTDDDPQYSGYASDAESYALIPKRAYKQIRLESNDQATAIAEAMLAQHQLWSEMGAAEVAMNVGAEIFDYVKVAAFTSNDVYRIGNLGHLCRHWNADRMEWRMTFSFGNWMTVRKALANLDSTGSISANDLEGYFTRLYAKDAYIENLSIDQINAVWLDPDSNIDPTKLREGFYDDLPDGEVYARVKALHLDAGQIKLDENVFYASGYNPTGKFDLGSHTLDDVPEGVTYQRVKSAALSAAGLVLLDETVIGTYGLVKSAYISAGRILLQEASGDLDDIDDGYNYAKVRETDISAGHIKLTVDQDMDDQGFEIVSSSSSTRIRINDNRIAGYNAGVKQFELDASDGMAKCGGGKVVLYDGGISIFGEELVFMTSGGAYTSYIYVSTAGDLRIVPYYDIVCYGSVLPYSSIEYLGSNSDRWERVYGNPVLDDSADAIEGSFKASLGGANTLHVYSNGAWRNNT